MINSYLSMEIILSVTIALIVVAIAIIIFIILLVKKKPKGRIIVDDAFINDLITNYGGIANIKDVNVDNGRLKITVNNLDLVDLNSLKEKSQAGVFVTNDIIKTLYKLDSVTISREIKKLL